MCLVLCWCTVNLVIGEHSTQRPHRHHQAHHHHKHRTMHTRMDNETAQNGSTTEPMDKANIAASTAQPLSSSSAGQRSQKLFLISSSQHHHHHHQQHHQTADGTFQPYGGRTHQPHPYPGGGHQRTTDFGFDLRTRGSPRTLFADMPYTTTPATSAGATVQWAQQPRPEHRFSKPQLGYVCKV